MSRGHPILLEDKVISSDLSYCWRHVFRQQLISLIGGTDLSPGLDENQLCAPELGHDNRLLKLATVFSATS